MEGISLTTITNIFLHGSKIFLLLPISVTRDGTVKLSQNLKRLFFFTLSGIDLLLMYYFGMTVFPKDLRMDPYKFLAYLRGSFFSSSCIIGPFSILIKSHQVARILQKLIKLQTQLRLDKKRLRLTFCAILFQLTISYTYAGVMFYLMYHDEEKSIFFKIAIPIGESITIVGMFVSEIIFTNIIALITEYLNTINKDLRKLKNLNEKNFPEVW